MSGALYNDIFGRLTWDDEHGCWRGAIDWPPGLQTEVAIWQPGADVAAGLRTARDGLDWLQTEDEHALRCVAGQLLHVYNTAWRQDEEPLAEDEFIRRIELLWIGFGDGGELLLSYDDGGLFGGHIIDAEFGPDRSFRGARLGT